jgi:hypothetical protein
MRVLFIAAAATAALWMQPAQSQAVPDLSVDPYVMGSRSRRRIRPRRAGRILLSRNAFKANRACGKIALPAPHGRQIKEIVMTLTYRTATVDGLKVFYRTRAAAARVIVNGLELGPLAMPDSRPAPFLSAMISRSIFSTASRRLPAA